MTILYAIRHKPTGHFLPQSKRRRGFTNDEPCPYPLPRLFVREQDAKVALTWWLRGITEAEGHGPFDGPDFDDGLTTTPVPGRKAEDMEIVPMVLSERAQP